MRLEYFTLVLSSTHIVKVYWLEKCFLCLAMKVNRQCFEVVLFFQLKEMYPFKFLVTKLVDLCFWSAALYHLESQSLL